MTTDVRPRTGITAEEHGTVLLARIDGGPQAVLTPGIVNDLVALVGRAETDDEVHAVVLTGTHPERFVAHADIRWLQQGGATNPGVGRRAASAMVSAAGVARRANVPAMNRTPLGGMVELDRFHDMLLRMNSCGAVFIAALNGSALGGGSELALACDVRIMAEGGHVIGQPEVLLGFPPGGGGTQRLARLVGTRRALGLILDGEGLSPDAALAAGVVDAVVPPDGLLTVALARARYLGARPKVGVAACKRAVYLGGSMSLPEGLRFERAEFLTALSSPHAQAIMLAYITDTEASGDLPLYTPSVYAEARQAGSLPVSAGTARTLTTAAGATAD